MSHPVKSVALKLPEKTALDPPAITLRDLTPRQALEEAVTLHTGGQFKAAIPYYIHAVRQDVALAQAEGRSVDPDILHAAGVALAMGGKRAEAIEFLEAAIKNGKSTSANCWSALGLAYVEARNLGRAERCYQTACKLDPNSVANWTGFANLAYAGGNPKVGERRYRRALTCQARDPEELIAQGMTYLRQGHWRKGWRLYEARRKTAMWADRNPQAMLLRAQTNLTEYTFWRLPHPKDVVLIVAEQGIGDTVQFARYVRQFRDTFQCEVRLRVYDGLLDMLRPALPEVPMDGRQQQGHTDEGVTGWALLLSLPAMLRESKPHVVPEPIAPFGLRWQNVPRESKQDSKQARRVFVHSRGNAQHGYSFDRDAPPNVLEDAVAATGAEVVTANYRNVAAVAGGAQVLQDPTWRDTVDRLMTCDRVVSVDTGLCHVAGSLGIPMELIVPCICEWRWLDPWARSTPWYPSARLWHRTRTEKWGEVMDAMAHTWRTEGLCP